MFPFSFIGSGVDAQALASYNSLIAAGYTVPQGLAGINSAFKTIKTIYGTSDITTAISYFADPSLAYQSGAGSGTTLGQAIRTLPNLVDNTRATDAVQTIAASQPLLLVHSGENYWFGSGFANNFVSTPNKFSSTPVNTAFEYICKIDCDNTNISTYPTVSGSTNYSYGIFINLRKIGFWGNGNTFAETTNLLPAGRYTGWIKVVKTNPNIYQFYTSTDGVNYTLLESVNGTNAIINTTGTYNIGCASPSTFLFNGKIYFVQLSINGIIQYSFDASQYNASVSQTQWTSSTGEIWSINKGTTAGEFTGQLVYRTQMGFGGNAQTKSFPPNNNVQVNQPDTVYIAYKFDIFSAYQGLIDSNTPATRQTINNSDPTGNIEILAGTAIVRSGLNQNAISLVTGVFNGANSSLQINNGAQTIGNAGTQKIDGLRIGVLANSPPAFSLNGNIYSLLISKQADNSTQRTGMYNYIRSINNNAF